MASPALTELPRRALLERHSMFGGDGERGVQRPDRPAVAIATVRAVVAVAHPRHPELPLIAGGARRMIGQK